MKIPPAIATLSRFSRIHAIWPSDRPSIASPLTPSRIASGAAASGVISSGAAIWAVSPGCLPTSPAHRMGRAACLNLYREDVSGGTRSARGQRVSFLDCDLIRIFPSQHGHDRQTFLSRPLQAGQNPTSHSDFTVVTPGPGGTGTLGTAMTGQPAARAAAMPVGESSSTTQPAGGTPSRAAARR